MKTLFIILISALISLLILVGAIIYVINYVPFGALDFLTFNKPQNVFGTTLTDLQSTDTMSDFPTLYNANNLALNTGKIEVSSSSIAAITTLNNLTTAGSLATVGTITSGVWTGTAIAVNKGGTGTTSPAQFLVILGNGSAGLTVASSTGTAGQFLTSNGSGAYPSWQNSTVNQNNAYNWTGLHSFAATTTMATTTIQGGTGGLMPAGSITAYATGTPPTGWLLCNGASLAAATYPDLFAVIGYSFGGSGANFNVPNVAGRNILIASSTSNIGQSGGESNHTQTITEMPAHTHNIDTSADDTGGNYIKTSNQGGTNRTTSSVGSGTPFNVLDPYLVLNCIIKY